MIVIDATTDNVNRSIKPAVNVRAKLIMNILRDATVLHMAMSELPLLFLSAFIPLNKIVKYTNTKNKGVKIGTVPAISTIAWSIPVVRLGVSYKAILIRILPPPCFISINYKYKTK